MYSSFGIKILQNKKEDTWNAFYEGEVETFAIQLSQAITNMLFTPKKEHLAIQFTSVLTDCSMQVTKLRSIKI